MSQQLRLEHLIVSRGSVFGVLREETLALILIKCCLAIYVVTHVLRRVHALFGRPCVPFSCAPLI